MRITFTYKWRATQYGFIWYHSHFALQAWQGLFGGTVIVGPATANYDTDLGLMLLNGWSSSSSTINEPIKCYGVSRWPIIGGGPRIT
ncbi:hypothetical protein PG988_008256 [Apiospora saccharicola]